MIHRKYSLREAFKQRLLMNNEEVRIEELYQPYKTVICKRDSGYTILTLDLCMGTGKLRGNIYKEQDGTIYVTIKHPVRGENDETINLIASKLLSDDMYGIKATFEDRARKMNIVMGPDIIVRFEGEEETPYLELPPHVAYTC